MKFNTRVNQAIAEAHISVKYGVHKTPERFLKQQIAFYAQIHQHNVEKLATARRNAHSAKNEPGYKFNEYLSFKGAMVRVYVDAEQLIVYRAALGVLRQRQQESLKFLLEKSFA